MTMNRPPETQSATPPSIEPVAGVWACDNCGCRIQVVTQSDKPALQAFTCTCGTAMRPGEEHKEIANDNNTGRATVTGERLTSSGS